MNRHLQYRISCTFCPFCNNFGRRGVASSNRKKHAYGFGQILYEISYAINVFSIASCSLLFRASMHINDCVICIHLDTEFSTDGFQVV